jgi:carbonic anhydrase/acetyltransferase-like protein (isoleucine patch superfamily)
VNVLSFGDQLPVLGRGVWIADSARVIGDVVLGDEVNVWYGSVLRGDVGSIRVGARSNVQDLTMIHVTGGEANTEVGQDVTIGHRAVIHGATVEDGCLIGIGAILLDGCRIGEGSVVGAGAVVTPGTVIPPRSLVLGMPARVVRAASDAERAMGVTGARHYTELAAFYATRVRPVEH